MQFGKAWDNAVLLPLYIHLQWNSFSSVFIRVHTDTYSLAEDSIIGSAFVSKSAKSKLKLQEEKPSLAWKICDCKLRSYASITWERAFQTEIPWLLIFATSLDKAFLSCFASDARLETCNPNHPIYASLNALITEQRKIKQKKKFNKIWLCHSVQNSL
jgi:ribosomal protein L31